MSECMTIDVFAAEEKHSDDGPTSAKDIVQSILTDALHTAVVNTVSESNRIGDFMAGEEFLQVIGSLPVNPAESGAKEIGESREKTTCEEEEGEKSKEYKVIKEQALADSELRIENGKIHLQSNGANGAVIVNLSNLVEICQAKEVNKSQSCVYGDSDKKVDSSSENVLVVKPGQEKSEESSIQKEEREVKEKKKKDEEIDVMQAEDSGVDCDRPFTPFTTEELRKSILEVWKNVNSPVLNGWKGEMVNQPQEVVRLMEELAAIQVTPQVMVESNTLTPCDLIGEQVEKHMAKGIEETNLTSGGQEINVTINEGMVKTHGETGKGAEVVKTEEDGEMEVVDIFPSGSVEGMQRGEFNQGFDFDTKDDMLTTSLTDSDEAFIEAAESVIQVIEPQDEVADENDEDNRITFYLLSELDRDNNMMDDGENRRFFDYDEADVDRQEEDETFQRFRSGMTTVGPIKGRHCDPKLLTGPEIDYGRMTRISGSREMSKDTVEDSLVSSSSRKINLDEIDENQIIFFENSYVEFDAIVNHDIASLTKMQKIREVLSDQPKSDEDLREDEKIMRTPLDLKDVDGDSSKSYNVLDISIPLIPLEETNRSNINKDFSQGITHGSTIRSAKASNSKDVKTKCESGTGKLDDPLMISSSFSFNKSLTQMNTGQNQKHNTISRVFQKASNRFITKDGDSFLRNSRSLPRDTNKITNTESFRSLLDDCQTSAATALKKSKSLLRNTQNVFKAVSKTGFVHVVSGDKQVHSVEKSENRQSNAAKKSEFVKLKDSIKSRVGKTLKNFENEKAASEVIDQGEHQKKLSPKSPHVCLNQPPKKNASENPKIEFNGSLTLTNKSENFDQPKGNQIFDSKEGNEKADKEIEVICGVKFQGSRRIAGFSVPQDEANDASSENADYVIESVSEGEPLPAEEGNSERPKSATGGLIESGKSLTLPAEAARDAQVGSESLQKSLSNEKIARKNKKLSARIRSFWQTAFGKVKATTQKKDVS